MPTDPLQIPISWALVVPIAGLTLMCVVLVQFVSLRALRLVQTLSHVREVRLRQVTTFIHVLQWSLTLALIIIMVLSLLSTLGVDFMPLLTSAGVAGLAISMAVQSLLKDLIGGLLILAENQYVIGDGVKVGSVSGIVERITLRATYLRDFNGTLHIIPNGEVRVASNLTRDWSRVIVDLRVAYTEDILRVLDLLHGVAADLAQDELCAPYLLENPQVSGPLALDAQAFTLRVTVKTQPGKQADVAAILYRRIHAVFRHENVELPRIYLSGTPSSGLS